MMAHVARVWTPDGKWCLTVSTSLDAVDGEWQWATPAHVPGYRVAYWKECPPASVAGGKA